MGMPEAIAVFSVCLPVAAGIFRYAPRNKGVVGRSEFSAFRLENAKRLDAIHQDIRELRQLVYSHLK